MASQTVNQNTSDEPSATAGTDAVTIRPRVTPRRAKTSTTKAPPSNRKSSRAKKTVTRCQGMFELGQIDFDAVLTNEEFQEYEATQNETWGVNRRIAMITLARSKAQLVGGFGKAGNTDALLEMIERVQDWSDHLKASIEMAEMASARLMAVASAIIYRNHPTQDTAPAAA
jgi:hypothetical protein